MFGDLLIFMFLLFPLCFTFCYEIIFLCLLRTHNVFVVNLFYYYMMSITQKYMHLSIAIDTTKITHIHQLFVYIVATNFINNYKEMLIGITYCQLYCFIFLSFMFHFIDFTDLSPRKVLYDTSQLIRIKLIFLFEYFFILLI